MHLGLILVGAGMRVQHMVDIAQRAEQANFATMAIAEAWRSAWVPLSAMAAGTKNIKLAPYVLNAYARSPLITGMSAVDFQDLSDGRLVLGVGGGNRTINEVWQGIPHARVLTKMREYVDIQKRIARTRLGDTLDYDGRIHQMSWSPAVDPFATPYPVYLAAVFPSMLKVAARVADGIAGGATLSPAYLENIKQQARDYASAANRDSASLAWNAVMVFAMNDEREAARRAAREAICHFYAPLPHPYYEFTMREQGFGSIADKLLALMPQGALEAAVDAITDECLDTIAICGTPRECRQRIQTYQGLLDEMLLLNVMPGPTEDPVASYREIFAHFNGAEFAS